VLWKYFVIADVFQFTLIAKNEKVLLLLAGAAVGFWFNLISEGKEKEKICTSCGNRGSRPS
jgi:hypothetical protein